MTDAKPTGHLHFLLVFLFISINLRMPFSAANPLIVAIMRDLGLNIESSSLFALLPIVILGIAAPMGSRLTAIVRPRVLIIYALVLAIIGVIWRSYGGISGLFIGTGLIGLGLGITSTVILGVIKEVYPKRSAIMIGAYSGFISLGTSISAAAAEPVALALGGWRGGLAFWSLPLLLATILWTELTLKEPDAKERHTIQAPIRPLLGKSKAWYISLYYIFRVGSTWLLLVWIVTLMRQRGLALEEASIVLALVTAFMIPSSLLYHYTEEKLGGRRNSIIFYLLLSTIANTALLLGPLSSWPLFAAMLGIGLGALFTLGMTLIVSNSADSRTTIALSGFAQGMGFILGGILAWACSIVMSSPQHHLWICIIYAICALLSLLFGLASTTQEMLSLKEDPK